MSKVGLRALVSRQLSLVSVLAITLAAAQGLAAPVQSSPAGQQAKAPAHSKAPVIAEDPKGIAVRIGDDAIFSVKANGESLNYQWYVNDTLQKDVNAKSVKIAKVKKEYNGAKIYVVVSNPYGAATSKEAVLTVAGGQQTNPLGISMFRAVPEVIKPGQKARLEAIYTGGQGVITPGSLVIGTNQYVEVSPSNTTTYNLTVTAPNGQRIVANATVSVSANAKKHLTHNEETEASESNQIDSSSLTATAQDF